MTKCGIAWIVSRKPKKKRERKQNKEREKDSERGGGGGEKQDEKREIEGMKGTIVDLPVVWMPRLLRSERRGAGFMLLVHKFPVNGARMSRRPPFCVLPPLSSPFPASSRFSPVFYRCFSFSFLCLPVPCLLRRICSILVVGGPDPPLCEIARLFTKASPDARMTREEISKFIGPAVASHRLCCTVD